MLTKIKSINNKTTDIFRLLSDPTRYKILCLLFNTKEELCVNEISSAVSASQSATSHQLNKLEMMGIVFCERKGKTMCYKITNSDYTNKIKKIIKIIENE